MMHVRATACRVICRGRIPGATASRWLSASKAEGGEEAAAAAADDEGAGAAEDTEVDLQATLTLKDASITQLTEEVAAMKNKYMTGLADMENLRKRSKVAEAAAKDFAIQKFGKDLLNVADTMEMALANAPREDIEAGSNPAAATMLEGMEGINRMMLKTFTAHNLNQIKPAIGAEFDPNSMEAQLQVPHPDLDPGSIAVVMRTGYMLKERVLRAATVGVVQK